MSQASTTSLPPWPLGLPPGPDDLERDRDFHLLEQRTLHGARGPAHRDTYGDVDLADCRAFQLHFNGALSCRSPSTSRAGEFFLEHREIVKVHVAVEV